MSTYHLTPAKKLEGKKLLAKFLVNVRIFSLNISKIYVSFAIHLKS
jgi:hypothetical protein